MENEKEQLRESFMDKFAEDIDMEVFILTNDNPEDIADWWLQKVEEAYRKGVEEIHTELHNGRFEEAYRLASKILNKENK